jgi:hypothetical protein
MLRQLDNSEYIYQPFSSKQDHNLAEWLVENNLPQAAIDQQLSGDYPLQESSKRSLKSTHTLKRRLEDMGSGLGMGSWSKATSIELRWNALHDKDPVEFWWRDPITVARWLLRQPCNSARLRLRLVGRYIAASCNKLRNIQLTPVRRVWCAISNRIDITRRDQKHRI